MPSSCRTFGKKNHGKDRRIRSVNAASMIFYSANAQLLVVLKRFFTPGTQISCLEALSYFWKTFWVPSFVVMKANREGAVPKSR